MTKQAGGAPAQFSLRVSSVTKRASRTPTKSTHLTLDLGTSSLFVIPSPLFEDVLSDAINQAQVTWVWCASRLISHARLRLGTADSTVENACFVRVLRDRAGSHVICN